MNWYSPNLNTSVTAGARGTDPNAMCGNAIMFDAVNGKILTVGGSPNYGVRIDLGRHDIAQTGDRRERGISALCSEDGPSQLAIPASQGFRACMTAV